MAERRELMLIVGANGAADDRLDRYRVTQRVSPRVMIVEADDAIKEELQATDGVQAVLEAGETADDQVRGTLTDTEALFVDAYTRRARPKERLGNGLDWDAEGFLPPDPPHRA